MRISFRLVFILLWLSIHSQSQDSLYSILPNIQIPPEEIGSDSFSIQIDNFIKQHKYAEAISPLLKSIEYYSSTDHTYTLHLNRLILAKVYIILGWYGKAISHLDYCQIFFRQNNKITDLVRTLHLLVITYKNLGNIEMANYFLGQCEVEKPDSNDPICKNEHLVLDASLNNKLTDTLKINNVLQAIAFSKNNNLKELTALAFHTLGDVYVQANVLDKACIAYNNSLEISLPLNFYEDSRQVQLKLFNALRSQELFKQASEVLFQYVRINDTLTNLKMNEALIKDISKYEKKDIREERIDLAKDKRLFELKARRSNFTLYSLLFSIGAILLVGYFVVLFYQQKLDSSNIIHRQNEQINQQKIVELENKNRLENMQSMIVGQETERERIAKDLHDSLGGLLSTIRLRFDKLYSDNLKSEKTAEFGKIHHLVDVACAEVRSIAHDLKPGALQDLGLLGAIKDMLNRYKKEDGLEITFQHYGFEENKSIEQNVALQIYRIIQELVHNAIKHAEASEILVQTTLKENEVEVIVEDDGKGFKMEEIKKGMGLDNIQSRVYYLKGDLNIDSKPGKGTSTLLHIPVEFS